MSQIMAVSKPTKDVLTSTNPDDFIFHSNYDTLKYEIQGTITVTTNLANYYYYDSGWGTYYNRTVVTVAHGLGYIPYFAGYFLDSPNAFQVPLEFADAGYFSHNSVYADATYLYFVTEFNTNSSSGLVSFYFSYRVFKNDLAL